MKVIIRLEITDDERSKMAQSLGHSGLVTRKQVTEAVCVHVCELMTGDVNEIKRKETDERRETDDVPDNRRDGSPSDEDRESQTPVFVPSRGDEPYIYSPKDTELAAKCSSVLDATERLDRYIWEKLEENRE